MLTAQGEIHNRKIEIQNRKKICKKTQQNIIIIIIIHGSSNAPLSLSRARGLCDMTCHYDEVSTDQLSL